MEIKWTGTVMQSGCKYQARHKMALLVPSSLVQRQEENEVTMSLIKANLIVVANKQNFFMRLPGN